MSEKKTIWVVNAQENPIETSSESNKRVWRSNALAQELARQGHVALRWRSSFSHNKKQQLVDGPCIEKIDGVAQIYIPTSSYTGHFSFRRILSHYFLGRGFNRVIQHFDLEKPDIIHICNVPLDLLLVEKKFRWFWMSAIYGRRLMPISSLADSTSPVWLFSVFLFFCLSGIDPLSDKHLL